MARLELPIRAFIEDFCRRAFPDRDFSRGSAINDLVIKAFALLMQPLRHDIDGLKVGQTILNWQLLSRDALDALAANWGKFRQEGGFSFGSVRLYFDTAADYRLNYLEFYTADGTTFVLQAPARITTAELLAARRDDGTYTADVAVRSTGVGSRFALGAGSIIGVRNGPASLIRVENVDDFAVTAPDESNLDVVNSLYRNLGLRNLVNAPAIRNPLFETFPGLVDVFVAGPGHPSMVRDLVEATINGSSVQIHLGGMTDVWLKSTAVVQRVADFSFLPSNLRLQLVSAEQAATRELIYAFSRGLLSLDGDFSAPDFPTEDLDESVSVYLDEAGLAFSHLVIDPLSDGRHRIASRDLMAAPGLIPMPTRGSNRRTSLVTDLVGLNWANTDLAVGDLIRTAAGMRRVAALSGRVARLGPPITAVEEIAFAPAMGGTAGARTLAAAGYGAVIRPNDRLVIPAGDAAGHAVVNTVSPTDLGMGTTLAYVLATNEVAGPGLYYTYTLQAPPSAAALEIPDTIDDTCWVYVGADGGLDQAGTWIPIISITRGVGGVELVVDSQIPGAPVAVTILRGLRGDLAAGDSIFVERVGAAAQLNPYRNDDPACRYANVLAADFSGTSLASVGIGETARVGDVVLFDRGVVIPTDRVTATGGDGTFVSVVVDRVVSADEIVTLPDLGFAVPAGTRFAVMRNDVPVTSAPVSVTAGVIGDTTVTVAGLPNGVGAAVGLIARASTPQAVTTAGGVLSVVGGPAITRVTLDLTPPFDLTYLLPGDTLTLSGVDVSIDGAHTIVALDAGAGWVDIAKTSALALGAGGTGTGSSQRPQAVTSSTGGALRTVKFGAPRQAVTITMSATGYVAATPADLNLSVTQTVGGTTYYGKLESYNNSTRQWVIVPNDVLTDLFAVWSTTGEEVQVVGSTTAARPTSISASYQIGYFDPLLADLGQVVRQGTYAGILDSFDPITYTWQILPNSDFDLFDSTALETFVDLGSGSPTTGRGRGFLTEPASLPVVNSGTVVLNLNRGAAFAAGSSIHLYSRFGRTGMFFSGSQARLAPESSINGVAPFGTTVPGDRLAILLGDNVDGFDIDSPSTFAVSVVGASAVPEVVRIATAPPATSFSGVSFTAGATALSIPGSRIGFWGHKGRVLVLTVNGATYYLAISDATGVDSVLLADGLPVTVVSATVSVSVVDGFFLPWLAYDPAQEQTYRAVRPSAVAEVVVRGLSGVQTGASGSFADGNIDFRALIGSGDWTSAQDLLLYVDSGPDADVVGYPITGITGSSTLTVDHTFSVSQSAISYHIGRRPSPQRREVWISGVVVSPTEIKLSPPAGWDPDRFNTLTSWAITVEADQRDSDWWVLPAHRASSYDPVTGIVTLDTRTVSAGDPVSAVVDHTVAGLYDNVGGTGFDVSRIDQRVLVCFVHGDRQQVLAVQGSAVYSYNYYAGDFMTLPLVRIQSVQLLDPETLAPTTDLNYTLVVPEPGLRYSVEEQLRLDIQQPPGLPSIAFAPVRLTYLADPSVRAVDDYLKSPETRVIDANQMAKRMETISVSVAITVRSERTSDDVARVVSAYISTLRSTDRLTKDGLIRYLYEQDAVSSIDTDSFRIDAVYLKYDGTVQTFTDVSSVFGSDVASYLPDVISVTRTTSNV